MAAGAGEYKLEKEDLDMGLMERNGGDMWGDNWTLFSG